MLHSLARFLVTFSPQGAVLVYPGAPFSPSVLRLSLSRAARRAALRARRAARRGQAWLPLRGQPS